MSGPRPFFTCPGNVWRRDAALNGCHEDSIIIFKLIAEASDRDWRVEVSPSNHAFSVRQLILHPDRFRRWSEERINRALTELRARGCLLLATANDREWLEISDRLAYCKGHKKEDPLAVPKQAELPLTGEPQLALLDAPRIPVRAESEQSRKDSESAARSTVKEKQRVVTRAQCAGSDSEKRASGRFARGPGDFNDAEWGVLYRLIPQDMYENGDAWAKRWIRNRDACVAGMRDWQAKSPQERAEKGDNAAAYITEAFTNATQPRKSA